MARRLRIEFPGALHHLISRGNTRRVIFHGEGEARAFVQALEPSVVRSGSPDPVRSQRRLRRRHSQNSA